MTKTEYIASVRRELKGLEEKDIMDAIELLEEGINDRIDMGLTEEEAVADMADPKEAARQIKVDMPIPKLVKAKAQSSRKLSTLEIVLICLSFPVWGPLLIALIAVAFALAVSLLAIAFSAVIVVFALLIAGVACIFGGIVGMIFGQGLDEGLVAGLVGALKIVEELAARIDHLDEAEAGTVVLLVGLEVLGEVLDALGEDGNLDLAGTGVLLVALELFADRDGVDLAHGVGVSLILLSGLARGRIQHRGGSAQPPKIGNSHFPLSDAAYLPASTYAKTRKWKTLQSMLRLQGGNRAYHDAILFSRVGEFPNGREYHLKRQRPRFRLIDPGSELVQCPGPLLNEIRSPKFDLHKTEPSVSEMHDGIALKAVCVDVV